MRVIIPRHIHDEINYYVQKSPIEISGLGRVIKHDNGDMEVVKVYLLEQENTGASTDIDGEAVAKLMFETRKDEGALNFWWHSHVDMGVFWSGTDMATIKEFGKNGYLLSTVFNKKGQMRSSYFQGGTDFLPQLFMDELDTVITNNLSSKLTKKWDKEYESKAKKKVYLPKFNYKGYNYYSDSHSWEDDSWWGTSKKTKPKSKSKSKKTYLTDDIANIYSNSLHLTLNAQQIEDWAELLGALRNDDPMGLADEDIWKFYELWDGDYNQAHLHVVTQLSMQEIEEEFEDTELSTRRVK